MDEEKGSDIGIFGRDDIDGMVGMDDEGNAEDKEDGDSDDNGEDAGDHDRDSCFCPAIFRGPFTMVAS